MLDMCSKMKPMLLENEKLEGNGVMMRGSESSPTNQTVYEGIMKENIDSLIAY